QAPRGQRTPAGKLVTTPRPDTLTLTRNVAGANSAVTFCAASSVTRHVPPPWHAPFQRTKRFPGSAVGVRSTTDPRSQSVAHVPVVQSTPGRSAATRPTPVIE